MLKLLGKCLAAFQFWTFVFAKNLRNLCQTLIIVFKVFGPEKAVRHQGDNQIFSFPLAISTISFSSSSSSSSIQQRLIESLFWQHRSLFTQFRHTDPHNIQLHNLFHIFTATYRQSPNFPCIRYHPLNLSNCHFFRTRDIRSMDLSGWESAWSPALKVKFSWLAVRFAEKDANILRHYPQAKCVGLQICYRGCWKMTGLIRIGLMCSLIWSLYFWNRARNARDTDTNTRNTYLPPKTGAPEKGNSKKAAKPYHSFDR